MWAEMPMLRIADRSIIETPAVYPPAIARLAELNPTVYTTARTVARGFRGSIACPNLVLRGKFIRSIIPPRSELIRRCLSVSTIGRGFAVCRNQDGCGSITPNRKLSAYRLPAMLSAPGFAGSDLGCIR